VKRFSKEFKENLIFKSQGLSGSDLSDLAAKHGVLPNTLYLWRRSHAKTLGMSKKKKAPSPEEKFDIVYKVGSMTEQEAGELLRSKGLHSGIKFVTPNDRHNLKDDEILRKRKEVYEKAKSENPNRWSKGTRNWEPVRQVNLNHLQKRKEASINKAS
jgi:transposase-like protein